MSTEERTEKKEMAAWQAISGLSVEREKSMGADERDAGIRKLLAEVERRARAEFARGEKAPAGERTVYWDPLERICAQLEISRVKLSSLSRELTGLRAHEITDRIKAAATLPGLVRARVAKVLAPEFEALRQNFDRSRARERGYRTGTVMRLWKLAKQEHAGIFRMRWAMELGFANPARLQKACLMAFGFSIQEMEARAIEDIVQKIFSEVTEDQPQRAQKESGQKTAGGKQETGTEMADAIIQEAVAHVMRGRRGVA